ncbi:hypothetical protein PR048_013858 [Dryococelus australis]|uniref:DUF4371 domain-containing protein n=1 Tax=Dryococelus australis TaxID=614101 RepID=A0ABQ9HTC0_9NEOP|nr:hypothetical protein PR048_013858 [Dryococelus australis]
MEEYSCKNFRHCTLVKLERFGIEWRQYPGTYKPLCSNITRTSDQGQIVTICSQKVTRTLFVSRMLLIYTVMCQVYCSKAANYYAIIVNASPDSAHKEQTVFILHYLKLCTKEDQPEWRGQGYGNGVNMKGQYKGVQRLPFDFIYQCACHSLNLAGTEFAESCLEAITFFSVFQKYLNKLKSLSPQR